MSIRSDILGKFILEVEMCSCSYCNKTMFNGNRQLHGDLVNNNLFDIYFVPETPSNDYEKLKVTPADTEVAPTTPDPEPASNPRQRPRHIFGIQSDSKRVKERWVTRDRRQTVRCPDVNCSSSTKSSALPGLIIETVQFQCQHPASPNLNSVKKSSKRSKSSNLNTEASKEEQEEVLTPVSNIANKIENTNIQSQKKAKAATFITQKSSRISKVRSASERSMKFMSPLNSVSSTQGSSKRKRTRPDSKNSFSSLFDNLEGSPLLVNLEAKKNSNEEITKDKDDFISENIAPVAKQLKLDQNFNSIAAEAEQGTSGQEVSEIKLTEDKKGTPVKKTSRSSANSPAPAATTENKFAGGFFQITSLARTSPNTQSPKTKIPRSGEKPIRSGPRRRERWFTADDWKKKNPSKKLILMKGMDRVVKTMTMKSPPKFVPPHAWVPYPRQVTVKQVCDSLAVNDYPMILNEKQKLKFQDKKIFDDYALPLLASANPTAHPLILFTLLKAKWHEVMNG